MRAAEVPVPLRAGSFEEWWARTRSLAGPLARILESLPEPALHGLTARLRADVEPFTTGTGAVEIPGVALVATAIA